MREFLSAGASPRRKSLPKHSGRSVVPSRYGENLGRLPSCVRLRTLADGAPEARFPGGFSMKSCASVPPEVGSLPPSPVGAVCRRLTHSSETSSRDLGLTSTTTSNLKLVALNFTGGSADPTRPFTTPARPSVGEAAATRLGPATATLTLIRLPGLGSTSHQIESGVCTASGCSTPSSPAAGSAGDDLPRTAGKQIVCLEPGNTYDYRIVAQNKFGALFGTAQDFCATPEATHRVTAPRCSKNPVLKRGRCVKIPKRHHKPKMHVRRGQI